MTNDFLQILTTVEDIVLKLRDVDCLDVLIKELQGRFDQIINSNHFSQLSNGNTPCHMSLYFEQGVKLVGNGEQDTKSVMSSQVFENGDILLVPIKGSELLEGCLKAESNLADKAQLYVPVHAKGKLIGAFGIECEDPKNIHSGHIALLKLFSAIVGACYLKLEHIGNASPKTSVTIVPSKVEGIQKDQIIHTDKDGRITWVNAAFEAYSGLSLRDLEGACVDEILFKQAADTTDIQDLKAAIKAHKSRKGSITNRNRITAKLSNLSVQINPVYNSLDEVVSLIIVQNETSKRKPKIKSNDFLVETSGQELQYSEFLQTTNDFVITYDASGIITCANESWLRKMKYALKDVIGTNIFGYIHVTSQEHCLHFFNALGKQESPSLFVSYSLLDKDGNKVDVEGTVNCHYINGQLATINSYLRDVTELNALNIKNQEGAQFIRSILDAVVDAVVVTDTKGMIQQFDTKATKLFGWSEEEAKGNPIVSCIGAPDLDELFNSAQKQGGATKGNYKSVDLLAYEKNGNAINVSVTLVSADIKNKASFICFFRDISKRKVIEHDLINSKLRIERIMGSLSESVWGVSLPGFQIEYISESVVTLYGFPKSDWYSNSNLWIEAIHPQDKERVIAEYEALYTNGEVYAEYRIITADKKVKWIYARTKIIYDQHNTPILMAGISGDITAKKAADKMLSNYQKAIDSATIFGIADEKGNIISVNDKYCELTKQECHELVGTSIRTINANFARDEDYKEMWGLVSSGTIWKGLIENSAKDGTYYYADTSIIPFMEQDSPTMYVFLCTDSTKIVAYKEMVERQKLFYETILNNIPGNVAVFDYDGRYVYLNPNTVKDVILRKWLIGKSDFDYCNYQGISTDFAVRRQREFNALKEHGKFHSFIEMSKNEGDEDVYMKIDLLLYEDQGKQLIISYAVDITNIKNAELENVKLKSLHENILNNIPIDIALFDHNHKYLFLNKHAINNEEIRAWMIGKDDFDYAKLKGISNEFAHQRRREFESVISSDKVAFWLDIQENSEGRKKYKERRFHSFDNNKYVIGYGVDVTVEKEASIEKERVIEELIRRNNDLEQFSYIISHNLRLPVANIMGITDLLISDDTDADLRLQFLSGLQHSVKQLDGVICDLNHILDSRKEMSDRKEIVVFKALMDKVIDNFNYLMEEERIVIKYNFEEYKAIRTVPAFIYSVFINLITNSIKYRQLNVPLSIEVRSYIQNNTLVLSFKDNGMGIDLTKHKDQIFGLYKRFHSKIAGKGMGLYMVKSQVESMGGRISVVSEVNVGTEFLIEFGFDKIGLASK